MADPRRRASKSPPNAPQVEFTPGLAAELLGQLAPLLAEAGIDINRLEAVDPQVLQQAMNGAVEQLNMIRFTPEDAAREQAVTALRLTVEAITEDNTALAAAILDQVVPDSPDDSAATVAGCIGVALGLLDRWLPGDDPQPPRDLGRRTELPAGRWQGEDAAADILALARDRNAFRSLDVLITGHGGQHMLHGSVLALAGAIQAWSAASDTPVPDLARSLIR
jgi:ElaB/YqjD/DUF883 family membrane-anchored ribosome-binding protein